MVHVGPILVDRRPNVVEVGGFRPSIPRTRPNFDGLGAKLADVGRIFPPKMGAHTPVFGGIRPVPACRPDTILIRPNSSKTLLVNTCSGARPLHILPMQAVFGIAPQPCRQSANADRFGPDWAKCRRRSTCEPIQAKRRFRPIWVNWGLGEVGST